ncbi:hypothetical protein [Halosimplex pelagicum]|uniref:Uncharacterized protein n=1 Tax=Halosimplex pelagicum TaxID=869886 RepID=A0A7D5PAZ3_9EURY|nr:hypothetical protein [Halosimplex pelagicum]QLH82105.1 hypothetical protein HZS54_11050 [Halosimplex pelagicum]
MKFTCPACVEDVEVDPVRIDGAQFNYRVSCSTPGCEYETKANPLPSVEEFVQAKHYAILETGSPGGLRSFHHVDQFGIPGGAVDVFLCVTAAGEVVWIVQSMGATGLYRPDDHENIEAVVQAHTDLERELFDQSTD